MKDNLERLVRLRETIFEAFLNQEMRARGLPPGAVTVKMLERILTQAHSKARELAQLQEPPWRKGDLFATECEALNEGHGRLTVGVKADGDIGVEFDGAYDNSAFFYLTEDQATWMAMILRDLIDKGLEGRKRLAEVNAGKA